MITVYFTRPVPAPVLGQQCTSFNYSIGDNIDLPYWAQQYGDAIICIEVSDDALEVLRYKFSGLPDKPHADTVVYRGEFARFILENWE